MLTLMMMASFEYKEKQTKPKILKQALRQQLAI
jgi:hypothetical protein